MLLVRQPADVAVSQFHQWKFRMRPHKKGLNKYPEHGAEVDVYQFVMDEEAGLPKVIEFMNAWAQRAASIKEMLVVRYEDLRADTAGELGRVLAFMGQRADRGRACRLRRPSPAWRTCASWRRGKVFWLAGARMRAKDKANPEFLQGAPRQGRRLPRLFRRSRR